MTPIFAWFIALVLVSSLVAFFSNILILCRQQRELGFCRAEDNGLLRWTFAFKLQVQLVPLTRIVWCILPVRKVTSASLHDQNGSRRPKESSQPSVNDWLLMQYFELKINFPLRSRNIYDRVAQLLILVLCAEVTECRDKITMWEIIAVVSFFKTTGSSHVHTQAYTWLSVTWSSLFWFQSFRLQRTTKPSRHNLKMWREWSFKFVIIISDRPLKSRCLRLDPVNH